MNRDDPLMETAIFGREVQAFLATAVGKYLVARAAEEEGEATRLLAKVLPFRWRRVQELQNQIYRAQSVQAWLAEAVMDGIAAERSITGEDDGN